jgi:tetratricopeptide (TPR) repeat protein
MVDNAPDEEFTTATALRDAGDLVGARAILERLAVLHSTVFGVWLTLGGVQLSQSHYEAAEKSFAIATALHPTSELASLSLFHTLKHLGSVREAFDEIRRFLTLRPESHEYHLLRQEIDEYGEA